LFAFYLDKFGKYVLIWAILLEIFPADVRKKIRNRRGNKMELIVQIIVCGLVWISGGYIGYTIKTIIENRRRKDEEQRTGESLGDWVNHRRCIERSFRLVSDEEENAYFKIFAWQKVGELGIFYFSILQDNTGLGTSGRIKGILEDYEKVVYGFSHRKEAQPYWTSEPKYSITEIPPEDCDEDAYLDSLISSRSPYNVKGGITSKDGSVTLRYWLDENGDLSFDVKPILAGYGQSALDVILEELVKDFLITRKPHEDQPGYAYGSDSVVVNDRLPKDVLVVLNEILAGLEGHLTFTVTPNVPI
jgi:hypothetical protein